MQLILHWRDTAGQQVKCLSVHLWLRVCFMIEQHKCIGSYTGMLQADMNSKMTWFVQNAGCGCVC